MSTRVLTAALMMLGSACGTAHAAAAPREGAIPTCLAAAQTLEAMRRCKRIVFAPCLKEPENAQSTHGLVMCNSRELEIWQDLLAARTAELNIRDPYRADKLDAANAAWHDWVEAECSYHRSESGGGSAETVITTECQSDLTADRVIMLTWHARGNIVY